MQTIQNDNLTVTINPKGAELSSVFHKQYQLEYLWNADPAFWAKKSPVLFPIVGNLKDNTYFFKDKSYHLSRHGFARDSTFIVSGLSQDAVTFSLTSDEQSFPSYPFQFVFDIRYSLHRSSLSVTYTITNTTGEDMYFSLGGHPAFKVPLTEGADYSQYYLEFNKTEDTGRWPISADGLIEDSPTPLLSHTTHLSLSKALFYSDALVLKHLSSNSVSLKSHETIHGLEMDFTGFPYFGIWAAKNADFVCLEPWCGIADSVHSNQQLAGKEGINRLETNQSFTRTWTITLF